MTYSYTDMQTLISTDFKAVLCFSAVPSYSIKKIMPNTSCGKLPKLLGFPQYKKKKKKPKLKHHMALGLTLLSETQLRNWHHGRN